MNGVQDVALVPVPAEQTPGAADPVMSMIERLAANPDVDVDKLQRLIDMQKDVMAVNAKAAFNAAFARMQAEIPTVAERGKTDKTPYATLEDIIEAVRPVLHRHGFSLSHRTEWPDKGTVKVVGILTHEQGFSRESEFLSAADASGSKNAIQALGSAVAYGRRYTTKDLLNIATRFEDDDGKGTDAAKAPAGYAEWLAHMDKLVADGCDSGALTAAWESSEDTFRKFIAKTDRAHVEGWKAKAKAVKRG